ncbi:Caffeine resistance protein 5 [Cyphellophora attinorum]|uniref:Caffeine resistance protein 5 n=1 Tax=Cyphellophora attinorum TaxID=1664694 RepID=A0A0N0NN18_9EURO|nr:Caffeine resistance protein 5 [Phialophora attinorum]KPI40869.1 Caffeine resistance protein 5 [Phialophora attinorum]
MVPDLIRDSIAGQLVRLATGSKFLKYPEERDSSLIDKYINKEKSANLARTGTTESTPAAEKSETQEPLQNSSANSSNSTLADPNALVNVASGAAVDPEKGRDGDVVDWYGPDDPENPQNWSIPKKFWATFCICFLTFSVYIGSAIYTAGIQDVTRVFGVSQVAATLGLTLFVLGYALGPMIWAPLSEIPQIGRNPIYIGTLALFVVLQVPTALAVNFGMLLAFRFITGFVGSPSLATGGASIADMYTPAKRTYGIAVWGIGAVLGPVMGPLVGGFAAEAKGWTWTIWELTWLSGFALVVLIFLMPETSSANILYRRTRRLRKMTGNDKLICEPELIGEQMTNQEIVRMVLIRPFTLGFLEPICFALNMYIALIYGLLYIWFESFPIVFVEIYGFSLGTEGLAFIGILVGAFVVLPPFLWWFHKYTEPKFDDKGELTPEWRLPPAFVGAFCIPICLFWFAWTSRESVHWIVPIIGTAFFSIGAFLLFNAVLNYLGDAIHSNDLIRSSFGAGFPLFASAMYKKLGVGWASSLLGFLSIAFIPIPFLLFKYGASLRKRSKNARQD